MSFSIEFYSTDKGLALTEIRRLSTAGSIPLEVDIFLTEGVKNLRTDTYERRTDDNGKYIGGKLKWLIHVKADGHLCENGSNSYETSTGHLIVEIVGPVN